jgi:hypothetical protein
VTTTRKNKKAKVRTNADGSKTYGPYKGSSTVDGRPIMVTSPGKGQPGKSSTAAARDEKERSIGRKLRKDEHVAHKGSSTNKDGDKRTSPSATRVESAAKNIGDGNRTRHHHKKHRPAAKKK